jgi:hypothetical protein
MALLTYTPGHILVNPFVVRSGSSVRVRPQIEIRVFIKMSGCIGGLESTTAVEKAVWKPPDRSSRTHGDFSVTSPHPISYMCDPSKDIIDTDGYYRV